MINRLLLRVKTVQTLYSFFASGGSDGEEMERALLDNVRSSGDIYYYLLQMIVEISRYLQQAAVHSQSVEDPENDPLYKAMTCRKLRENRVSRLLQTNKELSEALAERGMTDVWILHRDVLRDVCLSFMGKSYFEQYSSTGEGTLEEDVAFWCAVLENDVQTSEKMEEMLEDMNIYWNDDLSNAVGFSIKTISRLDITKGERQHLQPIIKDINELEYAKRLLRYAIMHYGTADERITPRLKGWKLERISVMDLTILRAAYAELTINTETHAGIIINEYIEIAKNYCSDYSVPFISAVLYPMAREIRPLEVKNETEN